MSCKFIYYLWAICGINSDNFQIRHHVLPCIDCFVCYILLYNIDNQNSQNILRQWFIYEETQWIHDTMITSLLHQNDVATSFDVVSLNGVCRPEAIGRATILAPCHIVKYLQRITYLIIGCPIFKLLALTWLRTDHQDSSRSICHQDEMPLHFDGPSNAYTQGQTKKGTHPISRTRQQQLVSSMISNWCCLMMRTPTVKPPI